MCLFLGLCLSRQSWSEVGNTVTLQREFPWILLSSRQIGQYTKGIRMSIHLSKDASDMPTQLLRIAVTLPKDSSGYHLPA